MGIRSAVLALALLLTAHATAQAHGVHHRVERQEAVVVTFQTEDGAALAHARCDVRADGDGALLLETHCDASGRVTFVPEPGRTYVVRAFTEDGHGARVSIDPATIDRPSDHPGHHHGGASESGLTRVALGVALLTGLFVLFARVARRRRA